VVNDLVIYNYIKEKNLNMGFKILFLLLLVYAYRKFLNNLLIKVLFYILVRSKASLVRKGEDAKHHR